jgi:hypothetical protein
MMRVMGIPQKEIKKLNQQYLNPPQDPKLFENTNQPQNTQQEQQALNKLRHYILKILNHSVAPAIGGNKTVAESIQRYKWRKLKVDGIVFTRQQAQWLIDREPMLVSAGNPTELEWRLEHLADGSLAYGMLGEKRSGMVFGTNGGRPSEKALWQEFIAKLKNEKVPAKNNQ